MSNWVMYTEVKFHVKARQDSQFIEKILVVEMGFGMPFLSQTEFKKKIFLICFIHIFRN